MSFPFIPAGNVTLYPLCHHFPHVSPILQGDFSAAMASLETCLSVLTRALPSCGLDLLCSLSWNLIRYLLHRPTPLGWLVHQIGGKHEGEESRTSAKDAALVYHRLSQLQLTGRCGKHPNALRIVSKSFERRFQSSTGKLPQRSSLWALSVSLSAVNLSESAQGKMAPAQLAQIYVTAAIALRTVLGHHLSCLPVCLLLGSLSCSDPICSHSWHHSYCLSPRVTFWVVQRAWQTSRTLSRYQTACAGSSLRWGGSSSWAANGRWSQRPVTAFTPLRGIQVGFCQLKWKLALEESQFSFFCSWSHRPAAPLFLPEAFGESSSHANPATERFRH